MNVAVTWPKHRPLESYLHELAMAAHRGQEINYRVAPNPPGKVFEGDRCYMVYDGLVRGFNIVKRVEFRRDVTDPTTGHPMRPGWYIVRDPEWFSLATILDKPYPMQGFQGFRYVAAGLAGKGRP